MIRIQKIRRRYLGDRGVGIVAVLMIVVVLGLMGGVVTHFVATGAVSKTNDLVREQAFDLTNAGFEYALKRLDDGVDPDGETKSLGSGEFTVGYDDGTGVISISSNVSAMYGSASPSYSIQGPTSGGSMADCLIVDTTGAVYANSNTELEGITLQNTCTTDINVSGLTASWSPDGGEQMNRIRIDGATKYISPPTASSGTPVPLSGDGATISSCSTDPITDIRWDSSVYGKNFTLLFNMDDGTSKSAFVQMATGDEAACLNVDTSSAYVNEAGDKQLLGITIENSCAAPQTITIEEMTVSWSPTTPVSQMNRIRIEGSNKWTGSANSGVTVTLTNQPQISGESTVPQDNIRWKKNMLGRNFTIVYGMADGTSKTVNINLYATNMCDSCLNVNTAGAVVGGGGNKQLQNVVLQNACPLKIIVSTIRSYWSGSGKKKSKQIYVDGTRVYNTKRNSGQLADVNDFEIGGSSTSTINNYQFDKDMRGFSFRHDFQCFDGTSQTGSYYSP
ncbi:MAG: hypothetical protein HN337_07420 [Deltaproteobacteria bacterium]|jgi:hypothetical protein|nr:hypothetical protein [Deltaproteobacteria bacterium]